MDALFLFPLSLAELDESELARALELELGLGREAAEQGDDRTSKGAILDQESRGWPIGRTGNHLCGTRL